MPQLKSGRHVGLSILPYLDVLRTGSPAQQYFAVLALRLNVPDPEALIAHAVVAYFAEGQGEPPNAPAYNSGLCVEDVLEGHAGWPEDDVEEFRRFVQDESRQGPWRRARFEDLDQAIQSCALWESELMANDGSSSTSDVQLLKRAVIRKSAMEPSAMQQLRSVSKRA